MQCGGGQVSRKLQGQGRYRFIGRQTVLTFLRDEILSPFGVSVPIYLGKYTDDDFTAFYQTAVEPLLMTIAEAMKITLFTASQITHGRTIKFYDKVVQSLSFARRLEIAKATQEDALLSRPERRELLGYDPDDEPTRVSLNYIDVSIANTYQLTALSQGKKPTAPKQNKEDDEYLTRLRIDENLKLNIKFTHKDFYAEAPKPWKDLYRCEETGRLYCPTARFLMIYE